jgi:hypothetical protein
MSDDSPNSGQKNINVQEIFTDQVLESVILTRVGAQYSEAKDASLNSFSLKEDFLMIQSGKFAKKFPVLLKAAALLRRRGMFQAISRMDPQSQAIVKTAYRPVLQEIK